MMIASMITFWKVSKSNEYVIIRSSGVSVWGFLTPILLTVFAVGIINIALINPISSKMYEMHETIKYRFITRNPNAMLFSSKGLWIREAVSEETVLVLKAKSLHQDENEILSMQDYVDNSFKLLKYTERKKLFDDKWPIYTTTHNTPPSLYSKDAKVKNSFIANGSIIKGEVENSIISRNVVVEEGAVVKNCILFTKTYVGKNTKLEYVVADKNVSIVEMKKLKGDKNDVIFIKQGTKI
jgi:glucose-1-phosphate adenylyltransferase